MPLTKKQLQRLAGKGVVQLGIMPLPDPIIKALANGASTLGEDLGQENNKRSKHIVHAGLVAGQELMKANLAEKSPSFLSLFKKGNIIGLAKNAYNAAGNFIKNKIYYEPAFEAFQELIFRLGKENPITSLTRGFLKGADSSTFGFTNFSDLLSDNYNKMLTKASIEWKMFLAKNPEIRKNPAIHEKVYEEWIERGVEKALRANPEIRRIDLIIPSFKEIKDHTKKELSSLKTEVRKLRRAFNTKPKPKSKIPSPKATKRKQRTRSR